MPKKLSYNDFLKSFEFAPRLAIELLVENTQGELLLLKRESTPFKGQWHLPGGFLLKNEHIDDCIRRIAKKELGLSIQIKNVKKLQLFESIKADPRGHIIHLPVKIVKSDIKKGKYFSKLPANTISYQKVFLAKLGYK